jgi:hypothetical protein
MPIVIDVQLKGTENMRKSELNRLAKEAHMAVGIGFRRRMLPDRFTVTGGKRLKYRSRAGEMYLGEPSPTRQDRHKYAVRKKRHVGHSIPLVLTGAGKREALSNDTVVANRFGFKIPLPRKYNFRPKGGRINMADEIRRVSPRELGRLSKAVAEQLDRLFSDTGVSVVSAKVSNL